MPKALTLNDVAHREQQIYQRSFALASNATVDDFITDDMGTMWIPSGSRGQARAFYAGEMGVGFTEVRCQRVWMCIAFDAIRDLAHDLAADLRVDADVVVAYTWDHEGWAWGRCNRDHPNAMELWECTRA